MERPNQTSSLTPIVTSWNVRGLRKLTKVKLILNRLKYLKSKIIFIQESHLIASDIKMLTKRYPGQVFHAPFTLGGLSL